MYNITIIDDHPFTVKIIEQILSKQGFHVDLFTDPEQAVRFLLKADSKVDLIVSDMMMEKLSGMELLKKIKKNPDTASIPFIFLSASIDPQAREDAFEHGAVDFFEKPVNSNLFVLKIRSLLSNMSLSRLKDGLVLQGTEETLQPDDILAFCEAENLNGFLYISNGIIELEFIFTNGQIELDENSAVDFEQLLSWKHYQFIIARGKLRIDAARKLTRQMRTELPIEQIENYDFNKLFDKYDDLENVYIFKTVWENVRGRKDENIPTLLTCLMETTDSLNEIHNHEADYIQLELTGGRKMLVLKYNRHPMAFQFKSARGYNDLLEMWQEIHIK